MRRGLLHAVTADGLGQKALGSLLVSSLGQEKVNGLAVLIDGTVEIFLRAFDPDVRLVHAPADPHWALATVKRPVQLRAVVHDPPVGGGVIHSDTSFEHEFFDVACAQGIRHIPADARENDILPRAADILS